MNLTVLFAIIILFLMILMLFFFLKKEITDINEKSRVYFTLKAQEYTETIKRNEEELAAKKKQEKEEKEDKKEDKKPEQQVIYVEKKANYEINDLIKIMKRIDESFSVNNITTIKRFIETYAKVDKEKQNRYTSLVKMKKYIDKIGVYNIIVNDDIDEMDKIVNDLRLIDEDIFMEYYAGRDKLDVEEFVNYLDYEMGKCDPTIYVYVGNERVNYNRIDKRIKTIYSKDIYKGIKIVYLNKLYDYSLS